VQAHFYQTVNTKREGKKRDTPAQTTQTDGDKLPLKKKKAIPL
jgi:hypothetical protein